MIDATTKTQYDNLYVQDGDLRYAALNYLLRATEAHVDWAYEVWDNLLAHLPHKNNHVRAIAVH